MRKKAQGFTLIEIMVVIAIIAGLVTTVAVVVPKMQERQQRLGCMENLRQLGTLYKAAEMDSRQKAQKWSGVSLWLAMRKNGDPVKSGNERVLICPADQGVQIAETDADRQQWDNVDLASPPDNLCSYAGRDFVNCPFKVENPGKEVLGCDRQGANGMSMQHPNGIVIFFNEGDVQFMTREELGVSAGKEIVIGPDADAAMLKTVIYRKARKD
jgi:prepilin-type N-terminal cleavage/methylation domain-containing protein